MTEMLRYELVYHHDSARLFARIAHRPWAVFLDSGQQLDSRTGVPGSQYGHYDILTADPFITFTGNDSVTKVCENGQCHESAHDPFQLIKQVLERFKVAESDLPFTGGALGYFAYDLGRRLEQLPAKAIAENAVPSMQVGIYDWVVVVDHRQQKSWLVSNGLHAATREQWQQLCALFESPLEDAASADFYVTSEIQTNMDKAAYGAAFHQIQHYIQEGDCYQVNLAQRFSARAEGDGWVAYQKLREISPAPFMAYMNYGDFEVLSGSPERFLQVKHGRVETRPIKGTRPRADNAEQDAQHAADLQSSTKDRAENLMIVDLLRNDIGKNCRIGSVKADRLFQLQSFANVHHLVSIVSGELSADKSALDLLKGCFPGGSITGAPKLRSMEIIEELEPHRRGVYCGAIGYIGFDGNMDTNIAIRTAVYVHHDHDGGNLSFYAGGGIVADSDPEKEYSETLDKASSILKVMRFFQKFGEADK